jgi:hypothetical protein
VKDLNTFATRTMERMGSLGMSIIDFGMDGVGRIPGAQGIDDAWDKYTKFSNPAIQKVREAASIVHAVYYGWTRQLRVPC